MSRAKTFVIFLLLAALLICCGPLRRGLLSVLVMHDLLPSSQVKWLKYFSRELVIEHPQILLPDEKIETNLYRINDGKKHAAFTLIHGVNEMGKDDPRLVSLAETFARAGFAVLVPGLPDMSPGKLNPKVTDEIEASLKYFNARDDIVKPDQSGVMGFSIGSGPTIIAASRLGDKPLKFIVSFGGYFDLHKVIEFSTTGHFSYLGKSFFMEPDPLSRWFFVRYYSDFINNEKDADILKQIAASKISDSQKDVGILQSQLSPEGKSILDLIENSDPGAVGQLISGLPQNLQSFIQELNPAEQNFKLSGDVFIVHSINDNVIPYTQSRELYDYLKETGTHAELFLLSIFSHVNPAFPPFTSKTLVKEYIPQAFKFWKLIYEILGYRK